MTQGSGPGTSGKTMSMARALRQALDAGPVVAASVFDPLSARLAELAGFTNLHLSGFGVEASQIGAPDMGIMSMSELVHHAGRVADTVAIPVLSDIDTGFGGANNVVRTVRQIEKAGIAGVHIEDQAFPKRCPLLSDRAIVPLDTAVGRIKAALDARRDEDFVVVARTDADIVSINEAIDRCNAYLEAGADMVMPAMMNVDGTSFTALTPEAQLALYRRLCSGIAGKVMTLGVALPRGATTQDMIDAGFSYIMIANSGLTAAANALAQVYHELKENGSDAAYFDRIGGRYVNRMNLLTDLKLNDYLEADQRYGG